jgi:hypothetical protein
MRYSSPGCWDGLDSIIIGADLRKRGVFMLQLIHLPSGKIVDLSKCIAILPASQSTTSEVIILGTDRQIQIDRADLETLQQEIDLNKNKARFNLEVKTLEEENQHHQDLAQKLKDFNLRWERLAADEKASQESTAFKQILDAERPSGQKLYSAE